MSIRSAGRRTICLVSVVCLLAPVTAAAAADSVVAVVRGDEPDAMVARAVELIGRLNNAVSDGDKVVIKPNLTYYYPDRGKVGGMTTDVRVVAGLVKALQRTADCRITIAESSGRDAEWMFKVYGYEELAKAAGLDLVDLDDDERRIVKSPRKGGKETYALPETTMSADVMINVPVLKTHQLTGISIGMKNYYGLLPKVRNRVHRGVYHQQADEVLSDVAALQKTDLVLVDGLIGMEGQGPLEGKPVEMNLVIAGRDMVAVDAVAAAVMGFDPADISHLQVARRRGLGECRLEKIDVKGDSIEDVRKNFKPPVAFRFEHPPVEEVMDRLRSVDPDARFSSRRLDLDPEKYPVLTEHPFRVRLWRGQVVFDLSCSVLDRPQAVAEVKRWLWEEPTPTDTQPTTAPAPAGDVVGTRPAGQ